MEVFQLSDAPPPTGADCLFFHPTHLAAQTVDVIYSFILTSKADYHILAVFHCSERSGNWISPPSAPFGGILPEKDCSKTQLEFLLSCVRDWVKLNHGKKLTIKTAPKCYDLLAHELCHSSYLATGFLPNHTYSNHYIPIRADSFEQTIEPAECRRLSKGKKAGFTITLQKGAPDGFTGDFLKQCYDRRSYSLCLSLDELSKFATLFPENFMTFTARDGNNLIAIAIMVKVNTRVLYHFLSGSLPEYGAFSPSVMLFEAVYEFCQQQGFTILDLGISIDHHGNDKPSLSRFKANIGGLECEKVIYEGRF